MAEARAILDWWWATLTMLPQDPESPAYRRLRRLWADNTRVGQRGAVKGEDQQLHEFVNPRHENHVTATLWENFALFSPADWLPQVAARARLRLADTVDDCRWSYQWQKSYPTGHKPPRKHCDVVVHVRDSNPGERDALLVVEAKNLGASLGKKDRAPDYYLDIEDFRGFKRRALLYLVDEKKHRLVENQVDRSHPGRWGVATWQWLGGLQIRLARALPVPEHIKRFIAGALQYQFCQHGFVPDELAAPYLSNEPSMEELLRDTSLRPTPGSFVYPLWRLDR